MPSNPLSLKQRLAALSLAPSSPTSPTTAGSNSPRTPTGKRKNLFSTQWGKKFHEEDVPQGHDNGNRVQDVMSRMIFQAGVDYETRPMVVLNASALPDPREVSYDILLTRILSYLNLYVEADYTVVFFAAGGRHAPSWNWVWKAYRSLSRKYRKNLKRLFIVHSNFFSKMLFSLAGAIISPKFFRKITYISTLSELAYHVPLTQIDIPPAVYQENMKFERQITLPVPSRSNIFGVPLEELMGYDGEKGGIPRVVKDSIQFLRETGLEGEGLFRRSPNSVMLKQAQDAYDRGQTMSLETFGDANLAAVLLKKYLRDLPDPIFPESLYPIIRRCPPPSNDPSDVSSVNYIRANLLSELAPCVHILLSSVLNLMHDVSLRSASNRMDAHNLAIVLCPNLVKSSSPMKDVMMCAIPGNPSLHESSTTPGLNPAALAEGKTTLGMVIKFCIQRYYEVFDEVLDRSEARPPQRRFQGDGSSGNSTASSSSKHSSHRLSHHDDDEDIDDAMLVMPIGPSASNSSGLNVSNSISPPPSAWATTSNTPYKSRHRSTRSKGSAVRSMHNMTSENENGNSGMSQIIPSQSKARSMISVEKGDTGATVGTIGRRGSISVGRGTTKKSSGAGVEAISITAAGFFSPPSSAPPVPSLPKSPGSE